MARTDTPKRPTAPEPVDPEPVDPEPAGSQSDDPADEDTSPQPQVELDQSVINGFEGINEEIVVDTSEGRHVYLIGTDDEYIRLAPSAYRLLKKRLAGYSFSEIAERLREHDVAATDRKSVV